MIVVNIMIVLETGIYTGGQVMFGVLFIAFSWCSRFMKDLGRFRDGHLETYLSFFFNCKCMSKGVCGSTPFAWWHAQYSRNRSSCIRANNITVVMTSDVVEFWYIVKAEGVFPVM